MKKRLPLFVSFILFIILSASLAYWGMQFYKPPTRPVAAPPPMAAPEAPLDAAAGLFGGRLAAATASNFQLKGLIAGRNASNGSSVALLVADGKPAKAVAVGGEVSPGVSLKEVHPQYVLLSDSGVLKRVDLPPDAKRSEGAAGVSYASPDGGSRMTGPQLPAPLIGVNPNLIQPPAEPQQQPVPQPPQPQQQPQPQPQPLGAPPAPDAARNKF